MIELKKCPFCGCKISLIRDSHGWNKVIGNHSNKCPLEGNNFLTWSSKENAPIVDKWNTRADGWISVDDRFPEIGQQCLIEIPVCDNFNIENGKYKGSGVWIGAWCDSRGNGCPYKVTRWMPRP